jgi:hypothetical protein
MNYTLRYYSTCHEIWRWYWRSLFRGNYYKYALFLALPVALVCIFQWKRLNASSIGFLAAAVIIGVLTISVVSALLSQLVFKSSERQLIVNSKGWSTTIGKQSGSRLWSEIRSVEYIDDFVVITSNSGNALVIPSRAFSSDEQKYEFVSAVQTWHNEALA